MPNNDEEIKLRNAADQKLVDTIDNCSASLTAVNLGAGPVQRTTETTARVDADAVVETPVNYLTFKSEANELFRANTSNAEYVIGHAESHPNVYPLIVSDSKYWNDPVLTVTPEGEFKWHSDAAERLPKMEWGPYNKAMPLLLAKAFEHRALERQREILMDIGFEIGYWWRGLATESQSNIMDAVQGSRGLNSMMQEWAVEFDTFWEALPKDDERRENYMVEIDDFCTLKKVSLLDNIK